MSVLANGLFRDGHEYKAVFTDATGVAKGDDVRISGVAVGKISSVEVHDRERDLAEHVDPAQAGRFCLRIIGGNAGSH